MPKNSDIAHHLLVIKELITSYEKKYHREPGCVQLLAASKMQSPEKIIAAYQAGQRLFGENRLQEALEKIIQLSHLDIEWHFIGSIQRNKTRKIAEHFSWVHSVDSTNILERLNEQRPPHLPPINICLEVNISNEHNKSGINADELLSLAHHCKSLSNISLRGLMAVPAPSHDIHQQRLAFALLANHYKELNNKGYHLDTLSMGMSDDFEAAIAEGSTMVRIGTRLFGAR